jgi:hypothetical protein
LDILKNDSYVRRYRVCECMYPKGGDTMGPGAQEKGLAFEIEKARD